MHFLIIRVIYIYLAFYACNSCYIRTTVSYVYIKPMVFRSFKNFTFNRVNVNNSGCEEVI